MSTPEEGIAVSRPCILLCPSAVLESRTQLLCLRRLPAAPARSEAAEPLEGTTMSSLLWPTAPRLRTAHSAVAACPAWTKRPQEERRPLDQCIRLLVYFTPFLLGVSVVEASPRAMRR